MTQDAKKKPECSLEWFYWQGAILPLDHTVDQVDLTVPGIEPGAAPID